MSQQHTMVIANPLENETLVVTWNGQPEDQAEARRIFAERMRTRQYLAYAQMPAAPGKAKPKKEQVTGLTLPLEAERVWLTPRLVGG